MMISGLGEVGRTRWSIGVLGLGIKMGDDAPISITVFEFIVFPYNSKNFYDYCKARGAIQILEMSSNTMIHI